MTFLRRTHTLRGLVVLAAFGLALAACGSGELTEDDGGQTEAGAGGETGTDADGEPVEAADDGDGPLIVATTSILGDIVATLVGDDATVEVIMPAGVDPHGFEPSAQDAAMLREADLVVANGLMLEESLLSALEAAEQEGVRVFELADELDPIDFDSDGSDDHRHDNDDGDGHDEEGHEDGDAHDGGDHDDEDDHGHDEEGHDDGQEEHDHGPEDPHVWFDPIRMADGVRLLAGELADLDSAVDAEEWQRRGEAYAEELLALHEEFDELLAAVPAANRYLVTNHDSLGYLAARYDLEVLGTVIPGASTQAETDAQGFAELIETVEEYDVPAVFAENTDSTVLADQLASEVIGRGDLDVEVVGLYTDALGEDGSGAETYPGLLRTTVELIADALS